MENRHHIHTLALMLALTLALTLTLTFTGTEIVSSGGCLEEMAWRNANVLITILIIILILTRLYNLQEAADAAKVFVRNHGGAARDEMIGHELLLCPNPESLALCWAISLTPSPEVRNSPHLRCGSRSWRS